MNIPCVIYSDISIRPWISLAGHSSSLVFACMYRASQRRAPSDGHGPLGEDHTQMQCTAPVSVISLAAVRLIDPAAFMIDEPNAFPEPNDRSRVTALSRTTENYQSYVLHSAIELADNR
jgi:hypothetical protein